MHNTITILYNGQEIAVSKEVAELRGIKDGHIIKSKGEFWDISGANASHMIDRINLITDADKNAN